MAFQQKKGRTGGNQQSRRMVILFVAILAILAVVRVKLFPDVGSSNAWPSTGSESNTLLRSAQKYIPARVEAYIMANLASMGWDVESPTPKGCKIWTDPKATTQANYDHLHAFNKDLETHATALKNFQSSSTMADVMDSIRATGDTSICKSLRPHPDGIKALFPSQQLSLTKAGYVEPLIVPMRHPSFCLDPKHRWDHLMRMDYLVHDFEAMCTSLKPTSRRVLIDMGASLKFHDKSADDNVQPIVILLNLFEKFGFHFDHIYAYEVTYTDPTEVYNDLLPEKYFTSFHWINTGVRAEKGHKMNPLDSILRQFNEDDFVVVKLDIDFASIEVPLANQLLADPSLHKLVDHFYFEHHVHMREMTGAWTDSMKGTLKDTFDLMNGLRKKGVAAHFWP